MSDFQQYTLLKQGTSCIIANADSGIQWGYIAADYLLIQALQHNKLHDNNSEIICLLNDRSETDLSKSIGPIILNEKSSRNDSNADDGTILNLKVIPTYNCNSTNHILKLVKDYTDSAQSANNNVSNNTVANKNTPMKKRILFIYSLSELLLLYGLYHTQSLLSQLESICGCQHIIMVLHQSYHSSAFLSHLTSFFTVTSYIQPNDGTLSDEVLIQIQSLRKSVNTGKVSESKELFGKSADTFITPLKKYPSATTSANSSSSTDINDVTAANNDSAITTASTLFTKALTLSSNNLTEQTAITTAGPPVMMNINNRLITFDSTDPEFDEDSDPDNDLDL